MSNIQLNHIKNDISIKEIASIFYKSRPAGFSFRQNDNNCFRLAFIISGSAVYDFGNKKYTVNQNDLLFLKKDAHYTVTVDKSGPWEHIVISFDLWDDDEISTLPFKFKNTVSHPKQFEELFEKAHSIYNSGGIACNMEMKSIAYRIISMLLEEKEEQFFKKSKYKGIKEASEYIESNYKEKINVEDLALVSGYSISHFSRLFKELYSMSPIEYINFIRIERAKNMLKTQMFSLSEIAEECGFSNVYYFSRIFKQIVGVTPKKY